MDRVTRFLRRSSGLVVWVAALVTALIVLRSVDRGALSGPQWTSLTAWAQQRGPSAAVFAVLRLVAEVLVWYLLTTTGFGAAARIARWPGLVRATDALSFPVVRQMLRLALGVGVTASVLAGTPPAVAATAAPAVTVVLSGRSPAPPAPPLDPVDVPVMTRLPPLTVAAGGSSGAAPTTDPAGPRNSGVPTTGDPGDSTTSAPDPTTTIALSPSTTVASSPSTTAPGSPLTTAASNSMSTAGTDTGATVTTALGPSSAVWRVRPGDNFWEMAAQHLAESGRSRPSEADIVRYWHLLIAHNTARLVDQNNPDFIYPGQVFELPPIP